jgi:ribonuclease HI
VTNRSSPAGTPGRWTVYVDGAARGNPGPAAAGALILDAEGTTVLRISQRLGRLPNNQAEYQALLLVLNALRPHAPPTVLVRMDSELVVRQLNGQYRVKDPTLQVLHGRVQALRRTLGTVTFEHVPRAQNAEADRLANLALDGKTVDDAGPHPPG